MDENRIAGAVRNAEGKIEGAVGGLTGDLLHNHAKSVPSRWEDKLAIDKFSERNRFRPLPSSFSAMNQ